MAERAPRRGITVPLRDLSFWEYRPPMAPDEDCRTSPKNQPAAKILQRRARRPRNRDCLLKGCGQEFRPQQPLARYCGETCREQARQWRGGEGRGGYGRAADGQQKRGEPRARPP